MSERCPAILTQCHFRGGANGRVSEVDTRRLSLWRAGRHPPASGGQPLAGNSNSNIRQTHNHLGSMGLHKSSHTAGAREVGLMGAMASCAPPNTLLIAAPTPRPCPAPTPLSTAATQTELTMDALAKLEQKQAELKVENRRLKRNKYQRGYRQRCASKIANANQEQAARKVEN